MMSKNSLWSLAGGGIPAIAALIFTPYLISMLGLSLFAIVSLIISLTIFFYVYDLGMSRTLTYLISRTKPEDKSEELIGSAFFSVFFLGVLISVCLYLLIPYFVEHWIAVDYAMLDEMTMAFQLSTLGIVPGLISNVYKGVLEGKLKFKEANICKIFSGASVFIAPMIVVSFISSSLVAISISIVITRYFALILYLLFSNSVASILDLRIKHKYLELIWSYGIWAAVSGFISTTFVYGDRFVVAGYLGAEDLSVYIASQDVLIRYLLIPWSMAIVLMPVFSSNTMVKNEVFKLYKLQQKRVGVISFVVLAVVMLCGLWFSQFFNHLDIPQNTQLIVAIQVVGIFFCSLSQLPLIYLFGKGKPKLITGIFVAELIIYIMVAPWVFNQFGVVGASVVWSSRLIIEYFLLKHYAQRWLF